MAAVAEQMRRPWGTATRLSSARMRWPCGRCGRVTEGRWEHVDAGRHDLIVLAHRCECGAAYSVSVSLDWVAPAEGTSER